MQSTICKHAVPPVTGAQPDTGAHPCPTLLVRTSPVGPPQNTVVSSEQL